MPSKDFSSEGIVLIRNFQFHPSVDDVGLETVEFYNFRVPCTFAEIMDKKLVCSYDEYSVNDIFNQILKYTIEALIRSPYVSAITKKDLKKKVIFFSGIQATAPTKANRKKLVFNRNNVIYKLLVSIALML